MLTPFTSRMHEVIVVVGPTASGKSTLAQAIAKEIDGEIVSADSMQVYKGLDIGTGKVMPDERVVPHYGLDLVSPDEPYSAALFQDYSRKCFQLINAKGKTPILCGGTGFYVRAAIDDYNFPKGEQLNNETRDRCNLFAQQHGSLALWEKLQLIDPSSAAIISPNDTKRVTRAFELLQEGESYARQKAKLENIQQLIPSKWIGLSVDPEILRARIDARIDGMVEDGLIDEVQSLLDQGLRSSITAAQAIGYKEIVAALDGEQTLEEAIDQIKTATHKYAKRQRTWFRKEQRITWIDANDQNLSSMLSAALSIIREECGGVHA